MSFVRADKKANKPKNLPTSEPSPMLVRSPKFKGKHSRENMQPSSEQRSFDVIDANEDEERIRSKTAISFGLLVGDQLLGINDEMLVGIRTKALYKQAKELMLKARKLEFTEIIACRPVLVRSSPAPSVDAELAMKSSATKGGLTEQANKPKEKTVPELSSLPLEADALEISLRELTLLQQWIRTDSPLPTCEKGNSLLRFNSSQGDQSSRTSEKSEYTGTATTDAPRKRGILFRKRSQPTITFTEQLETSKVTSDISEEAELKKCDPRSGIVSYIKNAFNN